VSDYPEVWMCIECRAERTYGTQIRPYPPFNLGPVHKEGANLMCKACRKPTRHVFAGGTTAQRELTTGGLRENPSPQGGLRGR
jgi:hypothetical protein